MDKGQIKIVNFESSWKDSKAADNKLSHFLEVNQFCTSCTSGTWIPQLKMAILSVSLALNSFQQNGTMKSIWRARDTSRKSEEVLATTQHNLCAQNAALTSADIPVCSAIWSTFMAKQIVQNCGAIFAPKPFRLCPIWLDTKTRFTLSRNYCVIKHSTQIPLALKWKRMKCLSPSPSHRMIFI